VAPFDEAWMKCGSKVLQPPMMLLAISATPAVVSMINSIVVGTIVAVASLALNFTTIGALGLGAVGVAVSFAIQAWWAQRQIGRSRESWRPIFPSPAPGERSGD
jgi:site-specific recombinase